MSNRRDFFRQAAMLSGSAGLSNFLPASVLKAMAIDPAPGSTYLDAEHVVICMQENRSFDHCFGTLKGVRGFNDPRATLQPNGAPVWYQTDPKGDTYTPFRLDMHRSKATWMGDLPHSRQSQVDAFNEGRYDRWLAAKKPTNPAYNQMPLTLGYYNREDIPFYYALADAFTVCDQNFASAMTSTHPNRLFFWTGTVKAEQQLNAKANIRNTDSAPGKHLWKTFPERLTDAGVSWKFYQNEISAGGGFTGDERSWLTNFGCNPLEWFKAYNVKFYDRYRATLLTQEKELPGQLSDLESKLRSASEGQFGKITAEIKAKTEVLTSARETLKTFSAERYEQLSAKEKELFEKAFTTNKNSPEYRQIIETTYKEDGKEKKLSMPKGDILHQFRSDVSGDKLPTVTWLAPPQKYSDHPSAPLYGPWMVAEILDILAKKPEVWKKTIFILTYDENDGYFDHQPPFVAPFPGKPETGKVSAGIDPGVEHILKEDELRFGEKAADARSGPVGLGFRVPMVIASPWSRGGKVCSQVFDHTSTLQFLEHFLNTKTGKAIKEENISAWRRTVCGNLTSAFAPFDGSGFALPPMSQTGFLQTINKAMDAPVPAGFRKAEISGGKAVTGHTAMQEPGTKLSCALPYELSADGVIAENAFRVTLHAGNKQFGKQSAGSPFKVYATNGSGNFVRDYAVSAGDALTDEWPLKQGEDLQMRVHGPNGFFREFTVNADAKKSRVSFENRPGTKPAIFIDSISEQHLVSVEHHSYGYGDEEFLVFKRTTIPLDLSKSHNWYDFTVKIPGYSVRYAGRVESGKDSMSDPLLGGVIA